MCRAPHGSPGTTVRVFAFSFSDLGIIDSSNWIWFTYTSSSNDPPQTVVVPAPHDTNQDTPNPDLSSTMMGYSSMQSHVSNSQFDTSTRNVDVRRRLQCIKLAKLMKLTKDNRKQNVQHSLSAEVLDQLVV